MEKGSTVHLILQLHVSSKIGRGVFGMVYKASIGGGKIVAIKKLITSNILQYYDDFDREVRILGVMILELFTGRRPVEYGGDDVVVLSDYVRVQLEKGNVLDCVDPGMSEYPKEEVLPVLKLGLVCTSQIPSSRPSMPEIVRHYSLSKHQYQR